VRILSLGFGLPDPHVDNYNWASALSFFDYDAIVVDPAVAVSQMVEAVVESGGDYASYFDEPVENAASRTDTIGLADLLRRRRDETERLLARGGLVVCFAYPDAPHPGVSGFTGCHRYYWLPAPPGCDYGAANVRPAGGTYVAPTDYEHPFAELLERFGSRFVYRAILEEGARAFGPFGKVIGRSAGGAAVALDMKVAGGRVVLLPALPERLSQEDRYRLAGVLVNCVRNALLLAAEESPPMWLDLFSLPGLPEAKARLEHAESRLLEAEEEQAAAQNALRAIDRYRRILWEEGKFGLELPVRDALQKLGFVSFTSQDEPAYFGYEGERVLVEAQGSEGVVGMDVHYRLRQRLERKIAEGERPRGLAVVNGFRLVSPEQRPQQYEEPLRVAAESMRYCLLETTQLFEAVEAAFAGQEDLVKEFCRRILRTEGLFLAEEEPASDVGAKT
jgi:hypothetical protein